MTVLVVTTVHSADDTRIRERLIRTLAMRFQVRYATRAPGPTDSTGLDWLPLHGGRLRRWWAALGTLLTSRWDVAVIHDPELVPAGVIARFLLRRPVVFDVHEDLAAQIVAKDWLPRPTRPLARLLSRVIYRMGETFLDLTLAEESYRRLFRRQHPVFPNYPRYEGWPEPGGEGDGTVIYVGDVRPERGVTDAAQACAIAGIPLTVVGPGEPVFSERLAEVGGDVKMLGRRPHREALTLMGRASVGISPLRSLPNYIDSVPTKVVEYMAMGLPVVATDLPGTRMVVDGFEAVWLVPPGEVRSMARAVSEAATPASRVLAMSRVDRVRASFRWPEDSVLSHYSRLAGEQEPDTP